MAKRPVLKHEDVKREFLSDIDNARAYLTDVLEDFKDTGDFKSFIQGATEVALHHDLRSLFEIQIEAHKAVKAKRSGSTAPPRPMRAVAASMLRKPPLRVA